MIDDPQPEGVPSTLPQGPRGPRPLDAEAMRRRIGARLFGEAEAPAHLDRFRVLRTLGVGGMGVVYAAEDATLGRVVALKVIRDDGSGRDDERARILREARALARLSHPNVVQLHEVVAAPEAVFLVMEYIAGTTLLQWLRAGPRDLAAILAVFAAAGRGLAAAHRADIVHRDIKPSNILIGDDGRVRLVDFGLARGLASPPTTAADPTPLEPATPRDGDPAHHTNTGALAGTPVYMAPEAFLGGPADARSDQFAFCVALYESVYGQRPFGGDVLPGHELLRRELVVPARAGRRRVPRFLRRALVRGLAARPTDRFAAMDDLVAALEAGPVRTRRWLTGLAAAALAGAAALGLRGSAAVAPPPPPCPAATAQLAGVWDTAVGEAVRTAILSSDQPFAARAAAQVDARLGDYAGLWLAAHRDACEATRVRGEQSEALLDASMICLARRRSALAALTDQLRRADARVVATAADLAYALPEIAVCRDPAALARGWAPRRDDPRLDAAEATLVRAEALHRARDSERARALVDEALTAIQAAGDPLLEAEALHLRGRIRAIETGEVQPGIDDLHTAADRAAAAGDDARAWRSWKELASIAALVQLDPTTARRHLAHARGLAGRDGPPPPEAAAELLDAEAELLRIEDRPADALARRQEALELRRAHLPPDHPALVWSRLGLANATADAGRPDEAVAQLAALDADARAQFGDGHPALARLEIARAQQLVRLERTDEARALLERARPIVLRVYGRQNLFLAILELELANAAAAEGDLAPAIARARAALQLAESLLPPHHDLRVEALALLAVLYFRTDDVAASLGVHRELLALHDDRGLELDLEVLLFNLGDALCRLGRCAEGLDYFSRLLQQHAREPPPQPARRALGLYGLGFGHLEAGRPELALLQLEEAHRLLQADPDELPALAVDVSRLLARCLDALGRSPRRVRELRADADARARALGLR